MTNTRNRGVWNYVDENEVNRRINEVENYERAAREKEEGSHTYEIVGESEEAKNLNMRIDKTANPTLDNNATRYEALRKEAKQIRETEDKFINDWEKENRKTVANIRAFEDSVTNDKLVKEQIRLQAEIAKLQRVSVR